MIKILSVLLYFLVIFLIILVFITFLIIFPIKYRIEFKYNQEPYALAGFKIFNFIHVNSDTAAKRLKIYLGPIKVLSIKLNKNNKNNKNNENDKSNKKGGKGEAKNKKGSLFKWSNIEKVKKMLYELKPEEISVNGVYGFDEPHITGILCAIIYSLQGAGFPVKLELQPNFIEDITDINFQLKGKFVIRRFLKIIIKKEDK